MRRGAIGAALVALALSTVAGCTLPVASSNALGFFVSSQSPGDVDCPRQPPRRAGARGSRATRVRRRGAPSAPTSRPPTSLRLYLGVAMSPSNSSPAQTPANLGVYQQLAQNLVNGGPVLRHRARSGGSGPRPTSRGGCRTPPPRSTSPPSTTSSRPCAASRDSTSSSTGARPPTSTPTNGSYAASYPGDQYVDYIGTDQYDNPGSSWTATLDTVGGLSYTVNFAKAHGKFVSVPNGASTAADDPAFVNDMYGFITNPTNDVGYSSYFSYDGAVDSDITQFPNSAGGLHPRLLSVRPAGRSGSVRQLAHELVEVEVVAPRLDEPALELEGAHDRKADGALRGDEVVHPLGEHDVAVGHDVAHLEVDPVPPGGEPDDHLPDGVVPDQGVDGDVVVDGVGMEVPHHLVDVELRPRGTESRDDSKRRFGHWVTSRSAGSSCVAPGAPSRHRSWATWPEGDHVRCHAGAVRADRLVATLLFLQARGRATVAEVAQELEISTRTARRDLEALAIAGVPVYSQAGRGGGWSLVGGARTDLSGLTAAEARALFLVAGPGAATPEVKAALRKLVRALPETFRASAESAGGAVIIDASDWDRPPVGPPEHLGALQQAVVDGVQVRLRLRGPRP